jgi:WD40 repeat protein
MFRGIFFSLILAGVIVVGVLWAMDRLPVIAQDGSSTEPRNVAVLPKPKDTNAAKVSIGADLYAKAAIQPVQTAPAPAEKRTIAVDPIVIPNTRLGLIESQDVPSQRDGVLDFVGIEVKEGENPSQTDVFAVEEGKAAKNYRRLKEGDRIQPGQLLARVDATLARADVGIKQAKVEAANADKTASEKTKDEALQRYNTQEKLRGSGRGATSIEDVRGAYLTYIRYVFEEISKAQAIVVAKEELNQANKTYEMYDIRSKIPGVVKTIHKHKGEAVKQLEPVLQIYNTDRLQAVGMVEPQFVNELHRGMEVVIEPTHRENPDLTFAGHRLEVTGVAVSKDPQNPLIVSSSEDETVIVWERTSRRARKIFQHPTPVRAVACTPPSSAATATPNWCLSGGADGIGRLWNLDGNSHDPLRVLDIKSGHRGAIRCVAFSPDAKTCATGGEDGEIKIWDTADGTLRYRIIGHRNVVTAIHFTPDAHLVSVSRDNTVRIWKLGTAGAEAERTIRRRSSDVGQLGISPDGKRILDEQGREMRVVSLPGEVTENILQNPPQSNAFQTLALFSPPDGRLVLTTSGNEGVLQLWRLGDVRSYELRQFIPTERSQVTCAAFAPNGSFVVAGIKDRKVYLWPMPAKEEVERQITGTVINVENSVESAEGLVRIVAEFTNRQDRPLLHGDVVTMVVYPRKPLNAVSMGK